MSTFNSHFFGSLVITAALLGASSAGAAEFERKILRHIDPTTPVGALRAYERIEQAANEVCGVGLYQGAGMMGRRLDKQAQQCAETVVKQAVQRVNAAARVDIESLAGIRRPQLANVTNEPTATH